MPRASDLMEKHVVTVSPETPLLDVHRLFVEEEIGAAPVVDDEERAIGVITGADLVRALEQEHDTAAVDNTYLRDLVPYSSPDWDRAPQDFQDRLGQLRVSDAMTEGVVSVPPDTSAADVARTLREHRMHHLFVIDRGALLGVISSFDLMQLVERSKDD